MDLGSHTMRTVRLGAKNLLLHKGRSVLTMLGIVFGVCSVVAMLAIGEGASYEAQEAIRRLGSTNIILKSIKPPEDENTASEGTSFILEYGLTYRDAWRISKTIPHVTRIMPIRSFREETQFARQKIEVQVVGTLPGYAELMGRRLLRGRFLSQADETYAVTVCVVTENLARQLFVYQDPLQHALRLGTFYYRVVGVLESTLAAPDAQEGFGGRWDLQIVIPLATARTRFGEAIIRRTSGSTSAEKVALHRIIVQCSDISKVEAAALAIQRVLERFHEKTDFEMTVPLRLLRQAEETKRVFTIVLGSIAAISLLVGGIGIMNIMLATVTERTREIGIRRALGARKRDIVTQFLVETIVLSVGGGLIGVVLGWLIPLSISRFWDIKTIVTWWALVVAFGVSALVGVVFGLYPARRAANLDPIEALRHE